MQPIVITFRASSQDEKYEVYRLVVNNVHDRPDLERKSQDLLGQANWILAESWAYDQNGRALDPIRILKLALISLAETNKPGLTEIGLGPL